MAYDKNNPVNNGWATTGQVTPAGISAGKDAYNAYKSASLAEEFPWVSDVLKAEPLTGTIGLGSSGSELSALNPGGTPTGTLDITSTPTTGWGSTALKAVGPALVAYDYANTGSTEAFTRDLSDWRNGAKTGASLGSFGGPMGTVAGAAGGAVAGLVGDAFGIGDTKYKGYTPVTGAYNQNGDLSLIGTGSTGAKRYGSYNDAMNYLNGVNQQWNPEWSKIGDSEYGKQLYTTKMANSAGAAAGGVIGGIAGAALGPWGAALGAGLGSALGGAIGGGKKKKTYVDTYKANMNTGYNVMDDFTRGGNYIGDTGNLDLGWKPYQSQQDRIYQERYGNLAKANQEGLVNRIGNNAGSLASSVDQQQYDTAKRKLDQQLARGYLDQSGYSKALSQLNDNRAANRKALLDIGNNQIDQWKTDLRQEYQNRLDSDLTDDWIKNYNAWKSDDMSGLYNDANRAADLYLQNTISDDYLKSLMGQSNMYNPYQYMATGIADSNSGLGMSDWTGNRRKRPASLVYEGE